MMLTKMATGGMAAATGAVLVKAAETPAAPDVWALIVLGIPLGVLASALAGAAVRSLRDPSQPDAKIPARVLQTVTDGFIGGWLAMFLVSVPFTSRYFGAVVSPEVVGALCALLVQFIRDNGKSYLDSAYKTVLSWLSRRRSGDGA